MARHDMSFATVDNALDDRLHGLHQIIYDFRSEEYLRWEDERPISSTARVVGYDNNNALGGLGQA